MYMELDVINNIHLSAEDFNNGERERVMELNCHLQSHASWIRYLPGF